jgi:hypothetical protein
MKKKLIMTAILLGMYSYSNAQSMGDLSKAANSATSQATAAATKSFDVAGISNQITGYLSPTLKITDAQKPAVNSLVNELLNKKKNILPTALTDKAGYASKMTGIRNLFPSKMKGILNATQYTQLLGLLPKSATSKSPLTQMLF